MGLSILVPLHPQGVLGLEVGPKKAMPSSVSSSLGKGKDLQTPALEQGHG